MERRYKRDGWSVYIGGTWAEISNRHGVVFSGDIQIDEQYVHDGDEVKLLNDFIERHSVPEDGNPPAGFVDSFCRVSYNPETEQYEQIQAVQTADKQWYVQVYDDELVFVGQRWAHCKSSEECLEWMKRNFFLQFGIPVEVYRSGCRELGDKISDRKNILYLLSDDDRAVAVNDLRECVMLKGDGRDTNAVLIYRPNRAYKPGGNFIYSEFASFGEMTGLRHPVPVYDEEVEL